MKGIVFVTAFCLALLLFSSLAAAEELTVGTANGYASLTEAIQASGDGDTIHIYPGVYTDETEAFPLEINHAITIVGEPGVVLEGPPFTTVFNIYASDVTIQNINVRFLRWGIYNTGDRLTVSQCTFLMYDDTYRVSSSAIWLGGAYDCTIIDCEFTKCGVCIAGPPLSEKSVGLPVLTGLFEVGEDVRYFTSHTITGNTINRKPLYYFIEEIGLHIPADAGGLIAVSCDNITVEGIDVSDSSMGMELVYCNNVHINQVTADRCGIFGLYVAYCDQGNISNVSCNLSNHGIDVRACQNIGITDCSTIECEQGVFLSADTDCIADNCTVVSCGNGMFIAAGNANQFSDNVVKDNENGIYVQNEANMLVSGNEVTGNTAAGVRFLRSSGYVLGNWFADNQTGVLAAECEAFTLWHNTFSGNISTALYLWDIHSGKISLNDFKAPEKIFIEINGSIENTLIWNNMFEGDLDRVLTKSNKDALQLLNQWVK